MSHRFGFSSVVVSLAMATASVGCGADNGTASPGAAAGDSAAPATAVVAERVDPALAARGAELVEHFECHRCHPGTGLEEPPREKHCVSCHTDILTGRFEAPPEVLATWRSNIRSLLVVPDLSSIGRRLRRDWVERFLLNPHDLRPALKALMPRFAMDADQAKALAAHLVPEEAPPADFDDSLLERGSELYVSNKCGECHVYSRTSLAVAALTLVADDAGASRDAGGSAGGITTAPSAEAVGLSIDLVFTRDRFQPGALVAYLMDPMSFDSETTMPDFVLKEEDARALAAFLMIAPLGPVRVAVVPAALPVLARKVRWPEVEEKVFKKICWHCHSSPDYALGDGGAGNTGGFGFKPRGLDLSSSRGLLSGSFDDEGKRRSVLSPLEDGTPRLVAHLWARYREMAGEPVEGVRGMPLGFPPLTVEEIQLVATWIAQGRPL